MFKWWKKFKDSHTYIPGRVYDMDMAKYHYFTNCYRIKEMHFCMLKDCLINEPVVEDYILVRPFTLDLPIDGISYTLIDYPSIRVEYIDGSINFFFCYRDIKINKTRTKIKYLSTFTFEPWLKSGKIRRLNYENSQIKIWEGGKNKLC